MIDWTKPLEYAVTGSVWWPARLIGDVHQNNGYTKVVALDVTGKTTSLEEVIEIIDIFPESGANSFFSGKLLRNKPSKKYVNMYTHPKSENLNPKFNDRVFAGQTIFDSPEEAKKASQLSNNSPVQYLGTFEFEE